jgi:hypothetical protein
MYREKVSLEEAIEMEDMGDIILVSTCKDTSFHPSAPLWYQNYEALRKRLRNVSVEKLLNFTRTEIYTEVPVKIDDETHEWYVLYGVRKGIIQSATKDNTEYVYVLINPNYPDLVKIGMTERTVSGRVKSINATSTVFEWVAKFALPVEPGTALRVEQQTHKYFADVRVDSDHGNEREFFRIDPLTAFDKVREIGALFQVGNPIVY